MTRFELDFTLTQGSVTIEIAVATAARAIALFGPSGSGKTSILEAMAGLRMPQRGRIAIDGRVLLDRGANTNVPPRHRRIGYVPQDVLLFPHLDVRGNVMYGGLRSRPPQGGAHLDSRLTELLELSHLMDRRVASLSGGERQRVALARALHSGPDLLLLDEPLAAIDRPRRDRITAALLRIRDDLGVPIVYVTHAPDEAASLTDYAIVMADGRVVAAGSPGEVL
jgi:molybdate transport system ATP-binding protein